MKYFPIVWAGLWRKKTRTIFTILSATVAFLLFGMLQGFNFGLGSVVDSLGADRLYVENESNVTNGLPIAYLSRIKSLPGVRDVTHWTYFAGFFQDSRNPIGVFATDPVALFNVYRDVKVAPEQLEAMRRTRTGALIGSELAKLRGWRVGDRVPLGSSAWIDKQGSSTWYFDVVGIFDASALSGTGMPTMFFIHYDYFDEARIRANGTIHYFIAGLTAPSRARAVASAVDTMFANSANETRTQTEQTLVRMQLKQIGDINFIANAIVSAVLFTLLCLVSHTVSRSVRERIPEFAVLKTLGFSDRHVLAMVLTETLLLCLIAMLLGLGLAAALFPVMGSLVGIASIPWQVSLVAAALAAVLALASGLPPALRVARLNIVDALAGR